MTAEILQLAIQHHRAGRLREAAGIYQQILQTEPTHADALHLLGVVCQQTGQYERAIDYIGQAIAVQPDKSIFHYNLGEAFRTSGKPIEAIAAYRQALGINPKDFQACNNLAGLLRSQGRTDEAIVAYRHAIQLQPASAAIHSNLLYTLNFDSASDPPAVFAEHRAWAERHAEPLTRLAPPHANDRTPDRRLRIGYVSPHFRQHAVNFFIEPMLLAHDRAHFEVFCYSANRVDDAVTARLKSAVAQWRDINDKPDDEVAQMVRDDRIDILVDLTGHIDGHRLLVFARKPAPVQVTYLGYQNTTGMSAIDYRLTDERADPPGLTDCYYTEKLIRLPRSFFCYRPPDDAPPITPLPARTTGHVTFGSFNNFSKVNRAVLAAWWKILQRVPQSRLLVLADGAAPIERLVHESASAAGLEPARIEVFDRRPTHEYLQLIQQADVALDPFPFTGHTTTCDSVWMGVPVVMLEGQTYASRFGGSVLANVGLTRWIPDSVEQYVDWAVELDSDLDALAQLRSELRGRMRDSALMDYPGFTRNVEQAFRQMWAAWCAS
jgi:predicted O-linked N-acetylglucosamine transferase (SPINDLY family)